MGVPFLLILCAANLFGAPVVGPYGQWTVFFGDLDLPVSDGSDNEKEEVNGDNEISQGATGFRDTNRKHLFFSSAIPSRKPFLKPHFRKFSEILAEVEEEQRIKAERETTKKEKRDAASRSSPRGPGPVIADKCVAEGPGLFSGVAGEWCTFNLKPKNRKAQTVMYPEGTLRMSLEPLGLINIKVVGDPWGAMAVSECRKDGRLRVAAGACRASAYGQYPQLRWEVRENVSGEMRVAYKHDMPGRYKLHVTYDGLPIAGAPFEVVLTSGHPCPLATRVVGTGCRICYASPSSLDPVPELQKETRASKMGDTADDGSYGKELLPQARTHLFKHFINEFKVVVCDTNGMLYMQIPCSAAPRDSLVRSPYFRLF